MVWDDPDVDWSTGLVAVRSTWDYETRREEFLAWARALPWLLNSADVFAWNTDKSYLPQLAAEGVSVVPTVVVESEEDLPAAIAECHPAVVKPCVGAGDAASWSSTTPTAGREGSTSQASGRARGWCSRWSTRCAPRARPRSS